MDRPIDGGGVLSGGSATIGEHVMPEAVPTTWPGTDAPGWAAWRHLQPSGRWAARPVAPDPAPGIAYAELGLRAAAFALDAGALWLIASILGGEVYRLARFVIGDAATLAGDGIRSVVAITLAGDLLVCLVIVAAAAYCLTLLHGSIGQLALGLATLRAADGAALAPGRAFLRQLVLLGPAFVLPLLGTFSNLLGSLTIPLDASGNPDPAAVALIQWPDWLAPLIVAWFVVLGLSTLRDARGQGLHDRWAGSVVVREA